MTLVILAAGMGSRYGGLKQIDPITEAGEFIIDFSVFDAIRSGFDKVVFVIKEENLGDFRATVGKRFEDKIRVEYAFQKLDDLPAGYTVPEGRTKPWGTAQAMLAARELVHEPFAVINADDFYGRHAYALLGEHLASAKPSEYCMIGYILENTLTENGTVSRGICEISEDRYLVDVNERTSIRRKGDVAVHEEDGKQVEVPLNAIASMNCWGFTPDVFEGVQKGFERFLSQLDSNPNPLKCEYYLPYAVCELKQQGACSVKVYESEDAWYGVTYHEDKDKVKASIQALKDSGAYPEKLSK